MDAAWIALIGTVCGGVGLKLTEHWLGRNRVRMDDATQIRNELRLEIVAQKEEIRILEEQLEKQKREYYDLRDKYSALETELKLALFEIKREAIRAETTVRKIEARPPNVPPA